jgi:glutathione S-transferase
MKLYDLSWGPWTRRVTIYLKEKGIDDVEVVALQYGEQRSPEMVKKNPLGFLPCLELDDGTCLIDSLAINEYLEEIHPEPNFIGRNPVERARTRAFLNTVNELFVKALPIYANTLPQFARVTTQSRETAQWLRPFFDRTLASLELLADANGPFLLGERISLADCALYPLLHHNLDNYNDRVLTDEHPKLQRWFETFARRPSAPCPLRDDGLREVEAVAPAAGTRFWWQKADALTVPK